MEPENVTIHTPGPEKGSTLMEQGGSLPSRGGSGRDAGFLPGGPDTTRLSSVLFIPAEIYVRRAGECGLGQARDREPVQHHHDGGTPNGGVGGGGGVTKLVDHAAGRIVRLPNPKYPQRLPGLAGEGAGQKEELIRFYGPAVP